MQTRAARFRNRARQDNDGQISHPRILVVDDEDRSTFPGKKRREGIPTIGLFGVPNNKSRYKIEPKNVRCTSVRRT